MIDPKLDKLPSDAKVDRKDATEPSAAEQESRQRARTSRTGLSISDTVAGDAAMSVGGKGVDTSGVSSGSGAGAGMTRVTAEGSESPAPNIVPGARSWGTTPRGYRGSEEEPTIRLDTATPSSDEIAARAYRCWVERGCPIGSPEVDWERAEEELKAERLTRKTTSASA